MKFFAITYSEALFC